MTATRLDTANVWSQLSSALRQFIRRRVRDDHTADDLLQETFIRIHRGMPALKDDDRLIGWVYRIAHNVLTDFRRQRTSIDHVDEATIPAPVVESRSLIAAGTAKWLGEIVDTLPASYREAIRLSETEGLTQSDAARRLGLTLSATKSRIQRGRMLLKQALLTCCRFDFDQRGNLVDCDPLPGRSVCLHCDAASRPESKSE